MVGREIEKKQMRIIAERNVQNGSRKLGPVGASEYASIVALFEQYDSSEDGVLNKTEFAAAVRHMQPTLGQHALGMFDAADKNKDGWISFDEFLRMQCPWLSENQARLCIKKYGAPRGLLKEGADAPSPSSATAQSCAVDLLSAEERSDIEAVYEAWCTKGSPLKASAGNSSSSGLSFSSLKKHCAGIDPYTVGSWLHQHSSEEEHRLSKEDFVAMIAEHYRGTKPQADNRQEGDSKSDGMRNSDRMGYLVTSLSGDFLSSA